MSRYFGVRNGLRHLGFTSVANTINQYVPRGETNAEKAKREDDAARSRYDSLPLITDEQLARLHQLRALRRTPGETYGQYYKKIFTGRASPRKTRNKYEDQDLQELHELSTLYRQGTYNQRMNNTGELAVGGRKSTRRRRHRGRQTRRK